MCRFRVVCRRGSFVLLESHETRERARARALALLTEAGVWDVHVEDASGNVVLYRLELEAHRHAA